jgi:hypothetical protein
LQLYEEPEILKRAAVLDVLVEVMAAILRLYESPTSDKEEVKTLHAILINGFFASGLRHLRAGVKVDKNVRISILNLCGFLCSSMLQGPDTTSLMVRPRNFNKVHSGKSSNGLAHMH